MRQLGDDDEHILYWVLTRAAVDPEFRRRLLTKPHTAVEEATGVELPAELRIRFIEPPKDVDALIVLPHAVDDPSPTLPTNPP